MDKKCICGHPMTAAEWKNQWVCHRCGRTKPLKNTMTNEEYIKSMDTEDLAEWLVQKTMYQESAWSEPSYYNFLTSCDDTKERAVSDTITWLSLYKE